MEEALMTLLLADNPLATYVANKINWSVRPQAERLPAVVLETISSATQLTNDGLNDLVAYRVQIDCWAETAEKATVLKGLVIDALKDKRQEILSSDSPPQPLGELQSAILSTERRFFEEGANGTEKFHRVSLDFIVWFKSA